MNDYEDYVLLHDLKLKLLSIDSFAEHSAWDIEKRWTDEEKVKMGVKKADVIMSLDEFGEYLSEIVADINNYGEAIKCLKS